MSKPNPSAFKTGEWKSRFVPILPHISFLISWKHRLIVSSFSSFPFSPPDAMLCESDEESPWKQQNSTLGQVSDFAYSGTLLFI